MRIMQPGSSPVDIKNDAQFIKKWRPLEGWLVADGDDFVLPTHHPVFARQFYASYCRKAHRDIIVTIIFFVLILSLLVTKPVEASSMYLVVFGLLFLFAVIDKKMSTMSLHNCQQKVEFLYNTKTAVKHMAVALLPCFIALFAVQVWMTHYFDGYENLIVHAGNYYPNVSLISSWRFITGPLIHADSQHLIINAVLSVLFASMIPRATRRNVLSLLIAGAVVSHFSTYLFAQYFHSSFDALLGISGGSFALLACAIICYLRMQRINTALSLLAIFVLSELSLGLLSNNVSHVAHLSGFLLGITVAIGVSPVESRQVRIKS
ncbi:rhomboid family intramembrane serine protease [Alteromonas gilva]|uniref:Rhomboid family intramembrane serine protease n=1 Tax=Alteromonas gilva TaxID=2987522 RepID=A0ABT5L4T7_9ALTE|nr:rhomboid family intramembrane serine protease [Alteromonas gilva]MDC8832049.1 rhomboid family intramembrane serine protease [Alteromonas gilva]